MPIRRVQPLCEVPVDNLMSTEYTYHTNGTAIKIEFFYCIKVPLKCTVISECGGSCL
jgi:hypothetical protein